MSTYNRELRRLAHDLGWSITITNGGHYKLSKPGRPLVFAAASPSDRRNMENLKRDLRESERKWNEQNLEPSFSEGGSVPIATRR